jgi:L-amino acid N-acyltransferase YncA
MVTKEDLFFRQVITLKDGARVLLRPLIADDKQALLDLYLPVTPKERRYMRHNVNNPDLVSSWAEHVNYDKAFPLAALVGERIVGIATLHFGEGPYRHRAEIRIFLAKDFRQRGLGHKMLLALIEHAKRRSLYILEVQVVRDLVNDIKAFQKAGFQIQCTFEDFFMMPDGELCDVVYLTHRLRAEAADF